MDQLLDALTFEGETVLLAQIHMGLVRTTQPAAYVPLSLLLRQITPHSKIILRTARWLLTSSLCLTLSLVAVGCVLHRQLRVILTDPLFHEVLATYVPREDRVSTCHTPPEPTTH